MPFFSVIIPLYNKEKYLENTLKSALQQSFQDFEIIIVNDGSKDNSLDIAERLATDKIKIFNQENRGVSSARNHGIEKAEGHYICFLDADDAWMPNYLENLYQTILKFPDAGMYCSRYLTKINHKRLCRNTFGQIPDNYEGYVKDFFASSLRNRIALTSAVCLPKSVMLKIGRFDEKISSGQDLDYWIRVALKFPVVICKNETVIYNYHLPESLSKTKITKKSLPDFTKFSAEEKKNQSLKAFLDLYRTEYALHFLITGNKQKNKEFLQDVDVKRIPAKTKILLSLPPLILQKLLFFKRFLKKFGLDFTVYH